MKRPHTLADERSRTRKRKQVFLWFGNTDLLTDRGITVRSGRNKRTVNTQDKPRRPTPIFSIEEW